LVTDGHIPSSVDFACSSLPYCTSKCDGAPFGESGGEERSERSSAVSEASGA